MKQKKSKSLLRVVLCLFMGLIAFVALVMVNSELSKTSLTGDIVVYFKVINTDISLITAGCYETLDSIPEGVVANDLICDEILYSKDMEKKSDLLKYLENEDNVIEMSVKVTDLSDAVGGTIRTGDLINISCVDSNLKYSELLYSNVYVKQALASDGTEISKDSSTAAVTLVILVSEDMEQNIYSELSHGLLKISKTLY